MSYEKTHTAQDNPHNEPLPNEAPLHEPPSTVPRSVQEAARPDRLRLMADPEAIDAGVAKTLGENGHSAAKTLFNADGSKKPENWLETN